MLIAAGLITMEYEYVHIVWMRSLGLSMTSIMHTSQLKSLYNTAFHHRC